MGLCRVPCCPCFVIEIRSTYMFSVFYFFAFIWSDIWNSRVFSLGFRQSTVLLVTGCLQSQQDCVARPLGGRQRYCASSDINPSDSLCRMVKKVQTERAENSHCFCLTRSLLCSSEKGTYFNNNNHHPDNFCETQTMIESLYSIDRNFFCPIASAFSVSIPVSCKEYNFSYVLLVEIRNWNWLFFSQNHLYRKRIIPHSCISDWCYCEPVLKPAQAPCLAFRRLWDWSFGSTLRKCTGQGPSLSLTLFFCTLQFPIKISNLAALFLVKIL